MRCTPVALKRDVDGMRAFASGDLDHISSTNIPRDQGEADGEKIAVSWKRVLFDSFEI
jgi:hypothetical protein